MYYAIGGLIAGLLIGMFLPGSIPAIYAKYMSVALLAALDTVFGGLRAALERVFDLSMFVTGFFTNMILAVILVFLGVRLGIDLYYVALICFGLRVFNNTATVRRLLLQRMRSK